MPLRALSTSKEAKDAVTFFKFPHEMIPIFGAISKNEIRMLIAIMSHCNFGAGECYASVETLAGYTGLPRQKGQDALSKLIKSEIVERKGRFLTINGGPVSGSSSDPVLGSPTEKEVTPIRVFSDPVSGSLDDPVLVNGDPVSGSLLTPFQGHKEKNREREQLKRTEESIRAPLIFEPQEITKKPDPALELWRHWLSVIRPKFPKRKYPAAPSKTDIRNLPAALELFTVAEMKICLSGLIPWMSQDEFWAERTPAFYMAFSSGKGAGKTFDVERAQECIEAGTRVDDEQRRTLAALHRPQFDASLSRLLELPDQPCEGPETHEGQKVISWFENEKFRWPQLAKIDAGESSKKHYAIKTIEAKAASNEAASIVIGNALRESASDLKNAIDTDAHIARKIEETAKRDRAFAKEMEAAGCPIVELDELPF